MKVFLKSKVVGGISWYYSSEAYGDIASITKSTEFWTKREKEATDLDYDMALAIVSHIGTKYGSEFKNIFEPACIIFDDMRLVWKLNVV